MGELQIDAGVLGEGMVGQVRALQDRAAEGLPPDEGGPEGDAAAAGTDKTEAGSVHLTPAVISRDGAARPTPSRRPYAAWRTAIPAGRRTGGGRAASAGWLRPDMSLAMPWEKYRGQPLADVPGTYLDWCLEETTNEEPDCTSIREKLAWRLGLEVSAPGPSPSSTLLPAELVPTFRTVVEAGYRRLALKTHPDRGGSNAAMKGVNAAHDWCSVQGLL